MKAKPKPENDISKFFTEEEGSPLEPTKTEEPLPKGALTTAMVVDLTGVSQPTLSAWTVAQFIRPSIRKSVQGGKPALWNLVDVERIKQLRSVLDSVKAHFTSDAIIAAASLRTGCTVDQTVVLTATGPRIVDKTLPVGRLKSMSPEPILVLS